MSIVFPAAGRFSGPNRRGRLAMFAAYAACCFVVMAIMLAFHFTEGDGPSLDDIGGPFALIGGSGQTVTNRSFPGRYELIYFGYTSCPDACPLTLSHIADALDEMGKKADRLQVLFITVDPARDDFRRLASYTALFSPRIIGLTGSGRQIANVMHDYRVVAVRHGGDQSGDYLIDHSHTVFLMDPDGRFRGTIDPDASAQVMAKQLAEELPD